MNAIKTAQRMIAAEPDREASIVLSRLVLALETGGNFDLSALYGMDFEPFELAVEVIKEWRLDRYYASKGKLVDLSWQVREMQESAPKEQAPAG